MAEALRAGRHLLEVVVEREASRGGGLSELADAAGSAGVAVRAAERAELDRLSGGVRHQGVVGRAPPFPYAGLGELGGAELVVVLDGVTDPQNLGAVARSAEAAGAAGLVLPRRRSAQVGPAAEKAAAGAFSWLRVARTPNVTQALVALAGDGLWSVGLDGGAPGSLWDCPLLGGRLALVVGAEGRGLSRLVSERVDARVAIPMRGRLESLNAAAAAAVALFEVVRRRDRRSDA